MSKNKVANKYKYGNFTDNYFEIRERLLSDNKFRNRLNEIKLNSSSKNFHNSNIKTNFNTTNPIYKNNNKFIHKDKDNLTVDKNLKNSNSSHKNNYLNFINLYTTTSLPVNKVNNQTLNNQSFTNSQNEDSKSLNKNYNKLRNLPNVHFISSPHNNNLGLITYNKFKNTNFNFNYKFSPYNTGNMSPMSITNFTKTKLNPLIPNLKSIEKKRNELYGNSKKKLNISQNSDRSRSISREKEREIKIDNNRLKTRIVEIHRSTASPLNEKEMKKSIDKIKEISERIRKVKPKEEIFKRVKSVKNSINYYKS